MSARQSPIRRDLARLAADHQLGVLLNEIDELGKQHRGEVLPRTARAAATSLWSMLADLDLTDAASARAAGVWRPS